MERERETGNDMQQRSAAGIEPQTLQLYGMPLNQQATRALLVQLIVSHCALMKQSFSSLSLIPADF